MPATPKELASLGKKTRDVPVSISYRILELFSAGLYSSPNKAIEELVANSYDAQASRVHVVIPPNLDAADAVIWVIDDGESMDDEGIVDLWRIAASKKREAKAEAKPRKAIGKFGIGKLATYVLASEFTFVTKHGGKYRAVTMDYGSVPQDQAAEEESIKLDLRSLTVAEAERLLAPLTNRNERGFKNLAGMLFGPKAAPTWTVAALARLKPMALRVTEGRLKWVLSTALPLSPRFKLSYNGETVESAKTELEPVKTWTLGVDDAVAESTKQRVDPSHKPPLVHITGLGPIHGTMAIYEDKLTGGKAEGWGRSHGIFVNVRGRLINLDDPLFGLPALSHGPFSRFRLEIHADALDELLRSSRESVSESNGLTNLRDYISKKFNEARNAYDEWRADKERAERITTRIDKTPQSLTRAPLINAIKAVLEEKSDGLILTDVPKGLSNEAQEEFIKGLEASLEAESDDKGFIKEVSLTAMGIDAPLARFDAATGRVLVNSLHPFYANYSEMFQSPEPFELLALADILTEAYLVEAGVDDDAARAVLTKRDRFLRELVYSRQLSAPLVAQLLRDNVADEAGLEDAVAVGLRNLGFEVSPIGGSNEPDGTALARLGVRDEETGKRSDYVITYDAKSTGGKSVAAHTVGAAGIKRHRDKYKAQFSVVVARGFAGDGDPGAAANVEARDNAVTLLTIDDLAGLVLAAATRQLGFSRLRELFETCRTPMDSRAWITKVLDTPVDPGPIPDILHAIWKLQKKSPDPVSFAAVAATKKMMEKKLRRRDVQDWMQTARRMVGGYISINGTDVALEVPPEKVLQHLRLQVRKLPAQFRSAGDDDDEEDAE